MYVDPRMAPAIHKERLAQAETFRLAAQLDKSRKAGLVAWLRLLGHTATSVISPEKRQVATHEGRMA